MPALPIGTILTRDMIKISISITMIVKNKDDDYDINDCIKMMTSGIIQLS